ncbi:MAG TPA: aminopeptidase N [Marmoricola sp.]
MSERTASLTRQEAAARAALLEVERYDIALDLTGLLEGETVRSVATVSFRCAEPGATTFVDCVATVDRASLNGVPLDPASAERGRLPLPDLRAENVLVVEAHQSNTSSAEGIHRTVDPTDQLVYVWTSFEPDDARRVWACFDQPDLKAVHAFTVDAPTSWTVLSNTAPASVDERGSGRRWAFEDTPRLSPYVVVVNAGPFHEIRATRAGYDLGLYCRRSLVPVLERDAAEILDVTEHGLRWFGERFAMPFPQRRYDQVFVPDMSGAMENWAAVTHSDELLYRSEPTQCERSLRAYVVLHEMAHMWFGDLVTMRWWDDLWLNEAFATWAGTWAAAGMPQFADIWAHTLILEKRRAYSQDMSPGTHPIRADVHDVDAALARFDPITYTKGMSVLRQLAAYAGEKLFVAGLGSYFERHQWGNTTLADLIGAIGEASGEDLAAWTEAWLDHAGTDVIALDDGRLVVHRPEDGVVRPHRLDVASFAQDGTLVGSTELTLDASGLEADLPDAAVHLLNAGDLTFAATRTDPASRAWLRRRAGELPDVTARTVAVMEAWDETARDGASGAELARCVLSVLETERNPDLSEHFLDLAREAVELWAAPEAAGELRERLATVAVAMAEDPACRRAALRTLAGCASGAEHFAVLEAHADDDPDLAWRVLTRKAELGEYDDAHLVALDARDPDPESWIYALAVRTAREDLAAKEAAWQALMVERRVPRTPGRELLVHSFWLPSQAELLRPFAQRYLAAVRAMEGGLLATMSLAFTMYPWAVADEDFLAQAERVAQDPAVPPLAQQTLVRGNDLLARQLRSRRA